MNPETGVWIEISANGEMLRSYIFKIFINRMFMEKEWKEFDYGDKKYKISTSGELL